MLATSGNACVVGWSPGAPTTPRGTVPSVCAGIGSAPSKVALVGMAVVLLPGPVVVPLGDPANSLIVGMEDVPLLDPEVAAVRARWRAWYLTSVRARSLEGLKDLYRR